MDSKSNSNISIREYIDLNLIMRDKVFEDYKRVAKESIDLAYTSIEGKLGKLNELRQEVTQDRGLYITRIEQKSEQDANERRISALEKWQSKLLGIGIVVALISAFIGAGIMKLFENP